MPDRDLFTFVRSLFDKITALENRLTRLEGHEATTVRGVHNSAYPVDNTAILAGTSVYSNPIRGLYGVPDNAIGIWAALRGTAAGAGRLWVEKDDTTPDAFSSTLEAPAAGLYSTLVMVRLGPVINGVQIKADGSNFAGVYLSVVGYWF